MTSNSSKIGKLSAAFHEKREAMGIGLGEMAAHLGIQEQTLETIETGDWSDIRSDSAYELAVAIAKRLGLDLDNFFVDRAFFFGDLEEKDNRPGNIRRERAVLVAMTTAAAATLAWLLVPARDIGHTSGHESSLASAAVVVWQKPPSDQPYPVLGEVLPESPINSEGALISLRATDTCNARIVMESGRVQAQVLRTSEPWKLRVKGAFTLHLDNAGVVAVEVAGNIVQHDAGVGLAWSAPFDSEGNWVRPVRPKKSVPAPPAAAPDSAQNPAPDQANPNTVD